MIIVVIQCCYCKDDVVMFINSFQTQANGEIRLTKVLTTVLQKEGLRGLYAGNGVNCIRVFPFSAIVCLVYANLARVGKNLWIKHCMVDSYLISQQFPLDGDQSIVNSLWRMGAGASAGMIATLLTHPIDVVRARITVQQTKQYKGIYLYSFQVKVGLKN